MAHLEKTNNGGIKCDNPKCDFLDQDSPDERIAEWLNVPCPKCGENLLTQKDLDSVLEFDAKMAYINSLSEEELMDMTKAMYGGEIPDELKELGLEFTVDIHNGINIQFEKKDDLSN